MSPVNMFGLPEHLRRLSATGNPLEILAGGRFRAVPGSLGGGSRLLGPCARPSSVRSGGDVQALILAALHETSDDRMEFLIGCV